MGQQKSTWGGETSSQLNTNVLPCGAPYITRVTLTCDFDSLVTQKFSDTWGGHSVFTLSPREYVSLEEGRLHEFVMYQKQMHMLVELANFFFLWFSSPHHTPSQQSAHLQLYLDFITWDTLGSHTHSITMTRRHVFPLWMQISALQLASQMVFSPVLQTALWTGLHFPNGGKTSDGLMKPFPVFLSSSTSVIVMHWRKTKEDWQHPSNQLLMIFLNPPCTLLSKPGQISSSMLLVSIRRLR